MIGVDGFGYVELVSYDASDQHVIENARICYNSESEGEEHDKRLIRHLIRQCHMTPFESIVFRFKVKAPLFVARQWFRHRMSSFNELSLRYCAAEEEFYIPRGMSKEDEQLYVESMRVMFDVYRRLDLPKEKARCVLPLATYTKFYWTVNGSSLINFLNLRADKSAQYEMRKYAWDVYSKAAGICPMVFGAWAQESDVLRFKESDQEAIM